MGSFLGRPSNCISDEREGWPVATPPKPPESKCERKFGGEDKGKVGSMNLVLDPSKTGRDAENLDASLRRMIVGQDEAIQQIVNIYQMNLTSMNPPGRPIGNFLFLGPTGSGKTRIVEATAEALLSNPRAVIKIDCAEFQHSHEIAKLIGSPPGYLGHRETHPLLSQDTINQYQTERVKLSFILFDEIEKASDALWNLLLGILDKATLTLGDNRKVDFSRAMIFMTSNLGAGEMTSLLSPRLGFAAATPVTLDGKMSEKISRSGLDAARRKFTPEFMNRLDKIVVFKPLGEPELRKILDIELKMIQQRIFISSGERSFVISVADQAKEHMLTAGTDSKYGARHLKRALERLLVQPLSNLMATGQVIGGDLIRVEFDAAAGALRFTKEAEGMSTHAMALVAEQSLAQLANVISASANYELARAVTIARSSRR
jgi:ATP-dependent Clp protease ATP-binding subunit ClpB